jgi:membrane protein
MEKKGRQSSLLRGIRKFWVLFRRSVVLAHTDGCFATAKGVAYSALLCFFPLLTTVAALLVQVRAESISRVLYDALSRVVPPGTGQIVLDNVRVRGARPTALLVIATLVSLWAASRVMTSFMDGFRCAYHIKNGRPFFRQQGMAILLVLATAVPVTAAAALVVFGNRTEAFVLQRLGLLPAGQELRSWVSLAGTIARYLVAFAAHVALAATLYRLGPNRPQRWRLIWPGAVVSTILYIPAAMGFTWYVRNLAGYNVLYGSIAAAIALLVWMYVQAAVILIGCEFNAEYERMGRARDWD